MATWIGAACTPPANQYSSFVLTAVPGGEPWPEMPRTSATAKTGYLWNLHGQQFERLLGMTGSNQIAEACPAPTVGHTYMLWWSVVRGYMGMIMETLVCKGADGAYTTGAPGMMVSANMSPSTDSLGSFTAGSSTLLPPVFSPYTTGTAYHFLSYGSLSLI